MEYEAESRGGPIEPGEFNESKKISQSQFDELVDLIYVNDFFSFKDEYVEKNLYDATTYTVTVKSEGKIKSVNCYGPPCPEEVDEIIARILDLWGKEILEIGV